MGCCACVPLRTTCSFVHEAEELFYEELFYGGARGTAHHGEWEFLFVGLGDGAGAGRAARTRRPKSGAPMCEAVRGTGAAVGSSRAARGVVWANSYCTVLILFT